MNLFEAIVTAIVEGITEFLPISSTGHMVITSSLFGTQGEDFTKLFEVSIQLGAIMAVVVLYWKKFMLLFSESCWMMPLEKNWKIQHSLHGCFYWEVLYCCLLTDCLKMGPNNKMNKLAF